MTMNLEWNLNNVGAPFVDFAAFQRDFISAFRAVPLRAPQKYFNVSELRTNVVPLEDYLKNRRF